MNRRDALKTSLYLAGLTLLPGCVAGAGTALAGPLVAKKAAQKTAEKKVRMVGGKDHSKPVWKGLERATKLKYEDIGRVQLRKMTHLKLAHSHVADLFEHDFKHLENLKKLEMRSVIHWMAYRDRSCPGKVKCVFTLPENVFSKLTKLEHLNLSANQFEVLPPGLFSGLAKLRTLDLREFSVPVLPQSLFELPSIKTIRVSVRYVGKYRGGLTKKEAQRLIERYGTGVVKVS